MLLVYILLVFFLNIIKYYAVAEDELLAVTLIYRHGDRTPIKFYAKDPHKNSPRWPAPPGQLTNTGKLQLYLLGKWFRNRYDGFLSPIYNVSEIYVRSTDVDRCIMSAASSLAGLYPPHGKDVWNDDLPWQPIPIHTVPAEEDDIAKVFNCCPKYSRILSESQELPYYKQLQEKNKVFYEYLTNNTGEEVADLFNIFHLFDNIQIEKIIISHYQTGLMTCTRN
ncbi:hypothetical protein WA026_016760 [Henosepilachna vigintioctopunctata]|uniref:acid phosphatase n=1 Tax=Henosepilachna vigintioctopunctata TaxID=420089 RepID=A0AAW1V155_9CUCU